MGKRVGLVLSGVKAPKLRKRETRHWTKAKERAFLTALSETCNITIARQTAGVSETDVYRRRRQNAAFRAGWAEALREGYARLELMLLDRALNGTEKIVRHRDGSVDRTVQYSDATALRLLRTHRDAAIEAAAEHDPQEIDETRQRILSKLAKLKKRIDGDGDGDGAGAAGATADGGPRAGGEGA